MQTTEFSFQMGKKVGTETKLAVRMSIGPRPSILIPITLPLQDGAHALSNWTHLKCIAELQDLSNNSKLIVHPRIRISGKHA